ncbi:MAG: hypothetical protein R2728_01640 [Chitinophagales bacterium]
MKLRIDIFILILGALFSIILRLLFPEIYHHYDVAAFIDWAGKTEHFKNLYNTDCFCNYPVVGLLTSAGIVKLFNFNIQAFLYFLSFIDLLNVLIIYWILKQLNVNRAGLWAGIIGLLPSTWAGGGFWGQIDNVGQLILLLILSFVIHYNRSKKVKPRTFLLYIAIVGVLFSLAFLTKQLLLFPLMPLSFLVLATILIYNDFKLLPSLKYILICTFFTLLPIFLFDIWLSLPSEFHYSHLERVFLTGSDHMNKISGNGFNIWILLDRDMWSSSEIPFLWNLTPKGVGLKLFLLVLIILTYFLLKINKNNWKNGFNTGLFISFVFYLAMINLSFNIFLSGTHERYLFHFYPYILIALLVLQKKISIAMCVIASGVYGFFVLSILIPTGYDVGHQFTLLIHSILFLYLIYEFSHLNPSIQINQLD